METNIPLITIIIPVKNGSATVKKCLDAIFNQTMIPKAEVIIIDSGSTDETLDIVKRYPIRLFQISAESFNHGATRNYGVSLAKGEIIVMTVQDAIPTDKNWLKYITDPFQDEDIKGVCGRQMVPHDQDKNPGAWAQTFSKSVFRKVSFSLTELRNMSPKQKKNHCGWDNVTAAYRKSTLLQQPFPKTNYSEDIHWSYLMYQKGYALGYAPYASVWHYHHEKFKYRYKRHFIEISNHFQLYNLKTYPLINKSSLIPIYQTLKKAHSKKTYWLFYNIRSLLANKMAELNFSLNYLLGGNKRVTKQYFKLTKEIPIGRSK